MTGLLTVAAVLATITLIVSATRTGAQVTGREPNKRGTWGIAHWDSQRNRSLNPHERRWQTTLLSGKDNSSRWDTVSNEIAALEHLRGIDPPGPAPTSHNHQWIEASIANLEASIHDSTTPGDPAQ
ncbi:MAG: hypothetical protein ACI9TF_001545 [Paracrocinitomix sp.]|jgi:hypothetical protein|tara:strand:- start:74 stop:451 length:378 start_codon:yes stop_codon:yes gene_type:complete